MQGSRSATLTHGGLTLGREWLAFYRHGRRCKAPARRCNESLPSDECGKSSKSASEELRLFMSWEDSEEGILFRVVINQEEQYSILAEYEANPPGWDNVGKTGSKQECLQ